MPKLNFSQLSILAISLLLLALHIFAPISTNSVQANNRPLPEFVRYYNSEYGEKMLGDLYRFPTGWDAPYGLYDHKLGIIRYPRQFSVIERPGTALFIKVQRNGLWGAIDAKGNMIIPIEYDEIIDIQNTYGPVFKIKKGNYYGILDNSGKFLKPIQYSHVDGLSGHLITACDEITGCGILTTKGEEVLPLTQDGIIARAGSDYQFSISKNGKYGIIDTYGNKILDYILPEIKQISTDVVYTKNGSLEGISRLKDGKTILSPIYQNIVELEQTGYYKMKSNGKWGVVDINGNIIYPCKYGTFEINRMMKKYAKK